MLTKALNQEIPKNVIDKMISNDDYLLGDKFLETLNIPELTKLRDYGIHLKLMSGHDLFLRTKYIPIAKLIIKLKNNIS